MLGQPLLSEAELDVFVRAFERSGFTGGINWYRNIDATGDSPSTRRRRSTRRRSW